MFTYHIFASNEKAQFLARSTLFLLATKQQICKIYTVRCAALQHAVWLSLVHRCAWSESMGSAEGVTFIFWAYMSVVLCVVLLVLLTILTALRVYV